MKKSIFLAALVLVSAGCFAQKANVSKARNLADSETPDYAGARTAIKEALSNDETKDQANTWYVAGYVGYKEFDAINVNRQLGRNVDVEAWGNAVYESINYWSKAYELACIPTYDKKGKAKYDTRTPKMISPKLIEYYDSRALLYWGDNLYFDKQDPSMAYDAYMAHLNIPELQIFKDKPEDAAKLLMDTTYYMCLYYAGRFACDAKRYDEAIATLSRLNTEHAKANARHQDRVGANEFIFNAYMDQQDTVSAIAAVKNSIAEFPEVENFILVLVDLYLNSHQELKALEYVDLVINRSPEVSRYYLIKGDIISIVQGQYEQAFEFYEKAISLEPEVALNHYQYGVACHDYAIKIFDAIPVDADKKTFDAEEKRCKEFLQKALPYLKKAYELEADNYNYKRTLRSLYYRLGMYAEYEALED